MTAIKHLKQTQNHTPTNVIATTSTTLLTALTTLSLAVVLSGCQQAPKDAVVNPASVEVIGTSQSAPAQVATAEDTTIAVAPTPPARAEVVPVIVMTPPTAMTDAHVNMASNQSMMQSKIRSSTSVVPAPAPFIMYQQSAMPAPSNENYAEIDRNAVNSTREQAFATLSIDTDTGSYANVRRFINNGSLPPADAVRVEELINYFNYDFSNAIKRAGAPFLVSTETVQSPWHPSNRIIKVGIKAEDINGLQERAIPSNLVFLVDVSGSMSSSDKLQLAKSSLKMLAKQLGAEDTISLVTYAGNTRVVLPATRGDKTTTILNAIDNLSASGSTNGEAAIKLAYEQAQNNFKENGINRILMLTDGDFNVGVSAVSDMLEIIKDNRDNGISLSTLGFGQGNYNDHMMEQVADSGNGNYSYIDSLSEAKKVLVDEMSATFNTVAKDVKIQVEFNPNTILEWRLIGYENRVLAREDFSNDKVDAGELGAGKSVVALFEVTPVGSLGLLGESRYQNNTATNTDTILNQANRNEFGFLRIRYKAPNGDTSTEVSYPISTQVVPPSTDTKFAMAVAGYAQRLAGSKYINDWTYSDSKRLAQSGLGSDPQGTRHEFVKLVTLAEALE